MSPGSTGPEPGPPRLGRVLIAVSLPREDRAAILGDLEERFRRIRRERSTAAARLWYLRQAGAFVVAGIGEGARRLAAAGASRSRRGWSVAWAEDLRFALRSLPREPGFTAVTVLTLALGIGGTTAVFSVVDGVLLRPLPFPDPDRLVAVEDRFEGESWWAASPANVRAWREGSRTLEAVGWAQPGTRTFVADGEPRELRVQRVSPTLLDVLGVEARVGRGFREGEDRRGAAPVAVLTHRFWSGIGGDPSIVGRSLPLDGVPHTVVGVLPRGATGDVLADHDLLVPRVFTEEELRSTGRVLRTIARLNPDASPSEAESELETILAEIDAPEGWGVRLIPLRERLVGEARPVLFVLLGAVGFLLLVACANVSNLFLARGSARRRELAVRTALGAGRGRLLRQLLTEAAVFSILGGLAGILLATWGTSALARLAPDAVPRMDEIAVSGRVLVFSLGVTLLAGLLFGLVPAIRSTGLSLNPALHGSRGAGRSGSGERVRGALVASEVACVLVLLVGAGLMLTSFQKLRRVKPGFPVEDRVVLEISLPETRYPTARERSDFFRRLERRFSALPGVVTSGTVTHPPLFGDDWSSYHIVESRPPPRPGEEPIGGMEAAGPGYFEALGIPLLEGRRFRAEDALEGPPIVLVDQAMVERYWPDRSPLGDRVRLAREGPLSDWHEVVGVVGAVRYRLDEKPRPRVYLPDGRLPIDAPTRFVVVRTERERARDVVPSLRDALRRIAPDRPIGSVRTMEEAAAGSVSRARLQTLLLAAFGVLGLVLGAVGVYGVVSYAVSRRTRDVGVRLALGARRSRVLGRVLWDALTPVLVGVALGLAAALGLGRILSGMLFEVRPTSPQVLASVSALLVAVAICAAFLPGLRATRVDPVRTLRAD